MAKNLRQVIKKNKFSKNKIMNHKLGSIKFKVQDELPVYVAECSCGWYSLCSDEETLRHFFQGHAQECPTILN